MLKLINRLLFNGLVTLLTIVATTNMNATSLFMMYEPELPKGN